MFEITLSPGLNAIGVNADFDDIQIDFHDAAFAPDLFDQKCEPGLQPLAGIGTLRPQEDVLGGLLAHG